MLSGRDRARDFGPALFAFTVFLQAVARRLV
jgi:hypothetical protein